MIFNNLLNILAVIQKPTSESQNLNLIIIVIVVIIVLLIGSTIISGKK